MIEFGTLYDDLYKLNLDNLNVETLMILHHNVDTKCSLMNGYFAYLWHKCMRHIYKERMQLLVKNEKLPNTGAERQNECGYFKFIRTVV